ncbi:MAG TPA: hypothetical protein EYG81_01565 [Archaeoglobus profundus]|nr:hypothetical protein [Archaeoglobus profundus]
MKKFSSGITSLDAQLNGGFPSGSVILILEQPGAGGEVFTFHFALTGVSNNEKVAYISTNDTKDQVIENIKVYFTETDAIEKLEIVDLVMPRLMDKVEDIKSYWKGKLDPLKYVRRILSNSYDRIILNNLTYFLFQYSVQDIFELIDYMSLYVKRNDSIIFLLMTKGVTDHTFENRVKYIVDGIIELELRETENEIQRRLKILKLKRVLVPKTIFRYDLTDRGVRMESVMRIL